MTAMTQTPEPATLESLQMQALSLPAADRRELGNALLDSVPIEFDDGDEPDPKLIADLDRIVEGHLNGTQPAISEGEFREWLRSRRS